MSTRSEKNNQNIAKVLTICDDKYYTGGIMKVDSKPSECTMRVQKGTRNAVMKQLRSINKIRKESGVKKMKAVDYMQLALEMALDHGAEYIKEGQQRTRRLRNK